MRVDRAVGVMGFFDNMQDRPIVSPEWNFYDITGTADSDTSLINIGIMLLGTGKHSSLRRSEWWRRFMMAPVKFFSPTDRQRYLDDSGAGCTDRAITESVPCSRTLAGGAPGRDEILERAVQIVRN